MKDMEQFKTSAAVASAVLKSMCNEHRLMILCQLLGGEKTVGDIEKEVGISQSALSQHLARLRRDNLVETRRSAQNIFYSLKGHAVPALMKTLHDLFCVEDDQVAETC